LTAHPIARYIPLLIAGDERGLRELFRGAPRINDPHVGWVQEARFEEFVEESHQGLRQRGAIVEHVTTTATDSAATEECILTLMLAGSRVSLPVAVASHTADDTRLESVRIYHSMWPLLGFHLVRAPILPSLALVLPDVIGRYQDCLARGDVSGILQQFSPQGELHESNGGVHVHRGTAELRRFFSVLFSNGGGVRLEHCTVADAGARCSVESVVTTWGRSPFPHQAAAAVYERADTGLLAEVRIYDDVDRPAITH
jgi:SnoaL-like protein